MPSDVYMPLDSSFNSSVNGVIATIIIIVPSVLLLVRVLCQWDTIFWQDFSNWHLPHGSSQLLLVSLLHGMACWVWPTHILCLWSNIQVTTWNCHIQLHRHARYIQCICQCNAMQCTYQKQLCSFIRQTVYALKAQQGSVCSDCAIHIQTPGCT